MSDQSGSPGPEPAGENSGNKLPESSRIITENASDAIITIDQNSTIQFVNRAAERIFGYSRAELIGRDLTILMPDYLRQLQKAGIKRYGETGKRHINWEAVALSGRHRSGREIPLELSFGEYTENGKRYFTGIARDISERRLLEKRLSAQYQVTRALADAGSVLAVAPLVLKAVCESLDWELGIFWTVDTEQDLLRFVQSWHEPLTKLEEFAADSGRRTFERGVGLPGSIWASGEPAWFEDLANLSNFPRAPVATRIGLQSAFGFPLKLGSEVLGVIEFFTSTRQTVDPALLDMMSTVGSQIGQFIERKRIEEERSAILEREQIARKVAEVASESIHAVQKVTDARLAHFALDELLAELLDRIRDALHVDTVAILLLEPSGDELVAWVAKGLEEEVELGVRIPPGKGFAGRVAATAQPVYIEDTETADLFNPLLREKGITSLLGVPLLVEGRVIGVIHVGSFKRHLFTEDDTRLMQLVADRIALAVENARLYEEERTARTEAEAANRAKDEFLTILSHELRTPLTPIIGWLHMMQRGVLPQAEFDRGLSVLDRNSQALKRLINDLLDMSAILTGKMRLEEMPVPLEAVVREAIETVRPQATERDIQIDLSFGPWANPIVIGDRTRLVQLFWNLLTNAVKFSQSGGQVRIACDTLPAAAVIKIEDFGEGIPPDFLPYVFERFRQADGSKTRSHGGLGLGLALVKSFLDAHNGTIEVASDGPGLGTRFTVQLPVQKISVAPATQDEAAPPMGTAPALAHLLIVEDQPDTLEMMKTAMEAAGYRTTSCASADSALAAAATNDFDLIISDISMPEMDGHELIQRLRLNPRLRHTPAIAVSGYAGKKDAEAAIAAGFDVHLAKPLDPAALDTIVKKLLNQKDGQNNIDRPETLR
jgi:PAS domain S-box-containing protein